MDEGLLRYLIAIVIGEDQTKKYAFGNIFIGKQNLKSF
jgi:hypothetical protein